MIASRVGITAARRAAVQHTQLIPRMGLVATMVQARPASTTNISHAEADSMLAKQRLVRPVSPHLSIYKMDQTWFGASAWQRITGAGFACGLYGFSLAYLVAPLVGIHLESAAIASFVSTMPLVVKGGLKFLIAWPFTFHAANGVRHLVFDVAKGFSKGTIRAGAWGVWGASIVMGLGLVVFY